MHSALEEDQQFQGTTIAAVDAEIARLRILVDQLRCESSGFEGLDLLTLPEFLHASASCTVTRTPGGTLLCREARGTANGRLVERPYQSSTLKRHLRRR